MRKSACYGLFISTLIVANLFVHRGEAFFFLIGLLITLATTALSMAEMFKKEKKMHREYNEPEYRLKPNKYRVRNKNREYQPKLYKYKEPPNVPMQRIRLPLNKNYFSTVY